MVERKLGCGFATLLVLLAAAGCSGAGPNLKTPTEAQGYEPDSGSIVLGEALIRSEVRPDPDDLARATGVELAVVEVAHVFGKVYVVRFARAGGGQVDEPFTRRVVEALRRAEGVLSSEPNAVANPRASATKR